MSIVFHIGYPKAASTTLQKSLFANHSAIVNLGIYPTGNIGQDSNAPQPHNVPFLKDLRIQSFYQSLTCNDGVMFDLNQEKEQLDLLIKEYEQEKTTLLFSSESIVSGRFSNPEIMEKARRLQGLCPEAKILIIIRSQVDILKALYRDHPFDPRTLNYHPRPVSFSEWLEISLNTPYSNVPNTLFFNQVLERYEKLFPPAKILVLPLELLKENPQVFVKDLANFLEINSQETLDLLTNKFENQGISTGGNKYRRWRNYLIPYLKVLKPFRRLLIPLDHKIFNLARSFGSTEKILISEEEILQLHQKYAADNRMLMQRRSLPLKELGYLT
ncbi:MAG: sulfotransferase domain-containing protein [Xenococcus sp. (in: cyanobacteria)]